MGRSRISRKVLEAFSPPSDTNGLPLPIEIANYCALHGIKVRWEERKRKTSPNVGYWQFKILRGTEMMPVYTKLGTMTGEYREKKFWTQVSYKDSWPAMRIVNNLEFARTQCTP